MSPFSIFRRHPHGDLAAFADGRLEPDKARRVEEHLVSCEACRADVEVQREIRSLLQRSPVEAVPRSFALTPEMVGRATPTAGKPAAMPLGMGLRMASAGLALALALVVFIDASQEPGGGNSSDDRQMEAATDTKTTTDGVPAAPAAPDAMGGGADAGGELYSTSTPAPGGVGSEPSPAATEADGEDRQPTGEYAPPTDQVTQSNSYDSVGDDSGGSEAEELRAEATGDDNSGLRILEAVLLAGAVATAGGSVLVARKARRN